MHSRTTFMHCRGPARPQTPPSWTWELELESALAPTTRASFHLCFCFIPGRWCRSTWSIQGLQLGCVCRLLVDGFSAHFSSFQASEAWVSCTEEETDLLHAAIAVLTEAKPRDSTGSLHPTICHSHASLRTLGMCALCATSTFWGAEIGHRNSLA